MRKLVPTAVAALAAATFLAGCEPGPFTLVPQAPVEAARAKPAAAAAETDRSYLEKASMKSDFNHGGGAVSEAVAWMERYTKEVERRAQLEKQNRALEDQNRERVAKMATLQADLKRAQQELDEANVMMLRLNADLKAWKKDVLGYREEMRAGRTQTAASLGRILQLLGAEVPSSPLAATPPAGATIPAAAAARPAAASAKEKGNASAGS